jgi:hypothetical protein
VLITCGQVFNILNLGQQAQRAVQGATVKTGQAALEKEIRIRISLDIQEISVFFLITYHNRD